MRNINVQVISGHAIALGMAWHLDYGFWNIVLDSVLGWVYVGYKVSQLAFGV